MGSTEEALRVKTVGVLARGDPTTDQPYDRTTGTGWVAATTKHDYADAQRRGHAVTLLVTETTGAVSPDFAAILRALAATARRADTHDSTEYGSARASPTAFYPHHLANISAAITRSDALTLVNAASSELFLLAHGI